MSTLREAAQQALEAWDGGDTEWFKRAYTVMDALRAALAEPSQDREMLEMAAKAAGIELTWYGDTDPWCYAEIAPGIKWNPLTDDGDALRLAVKLGLDIFHSCISVRAIHRNTDMGASVRCKGAKPQLDPYAATRRAIVRAAFEAAHGIKDA